MSTRNTGFTNLKNWISLIDWNSYGKIFFFFFWESQAHSHREANGSNLNSSILKNELKCIRWNCNMAAKRGAVRWTWNRNSAGIITFWGSKQLLSLNKVLLERIHSIHGPKFNKELTHRILMGYIEAHKCYLCRNKFVPHGLRSRDWLSIFMDHIHWLFIDN